VSESYWKGRKLIKEKGEKKKKEKLVNNEGQ